MKERIKTEKEEKKDRERRKKDRERERDRSKQQAACKKERGLRRDQKDKTARDQKFRICSALLRSE